jgi:hypothetical protein
MASSDVGDGPECSSTTVGGALLRRSPRVTTRAFFATRLSIGGILTYSALIHLANQYYFLASLAEYEVLGPWSSAIVAVVLPWTQLVIGLCLLLDVMTRTAFLVAAWLFLSFSMGQAFALYSGLTIGCGCFGAVHERSVSIGTFAPTSLAFVLCAVGYCHHRSVERREVEPGPDG